jgi:hypothetical protein
VVDQWIVREDVCDGVAGANATHKHWEVVALVNEYQADNR